MQGAVVINEAEWCETGSTETWTSKEQTSTTGSSIERASYDRRHTQSNRDERKGNPTDRQHGVIPNDHRVAPSNGLQIPEGAPHWALSPNYVQQDYRCEPLVVPSDLQKLYALHASKKSSSTRAQESGNHSSRSSGEYLNSLQPARKINATKLDQPTRSTPETSSVLPNYTLRNQEDSQTELWANLLLQSSLHGAHLQESDFSALSPGGLTIPASWPWQEQTQKLPKLHEYPASGNYCPTYPDFAVGFPSFPQAPKGHWTPARGVEKNVAYQEALADRDKELEAQWPTIHSHEGEQTRARIDRQLSLADSGNEAKPGRVNLVDGGAWGQLERPGGLEYYCHSKYKKLGCGLLKHSDLAESRRARVSRQEGSEEGRLAEQELLDNSNVVKGRANPTEERFALESTSACEGPSPGETSKLTPGSSEEFDMSGQYPGHSRPPVGTPPPQTVWNHLTMTQGQGLNIHPTALSGAALNPAGFYTHPSMARASHLTSQLTPQLAHTQAPPTWHTPTVPSKTVTPSNAPGNPLFSLQMLVDQNRQQNQSQYRSSPAGTQSTLDLSATSEMAENYSRIPQDIPISLTARTVDKGSRNGNIISPPIPLNGEISSDSGISSSVPTPNSVGEPVSLSTKEIPPAPKITVKNFESNLKGVANLHDKIKEMNAEVLAQKVINLPPSVTIERVVADKKEPEVVKAKDTLSVIAQVPRNVLPVIVNLTSKIDKDVTDSPRREPSSERERKIEETSVRSPKNIPKRGKKGVDSLLEKLEGGNKKLGTENIGSVIVVPLDDKDSSSVKSMSPERQKSKSPSREDEVVSPSFSNEDSNDTTKQRRKRKLEKPVRLSKDSKTEVEDMELEPTEPTGPRICEPLLDEATPPGAATTTSVPVKTEEERSTQDRQVEDRTSTQVGPEEDEEMEEERPEHRLAEEHPEEQEDVTEVGRLEENQPIRRRRSSEGPVATSCSASTNQRVRRKSSDDVTELSKAVTSPKNVNNANPFNEVESELEKMFAGIVETEMDVKGEVQAKPEAASTEAVKSEDKDLETLGTKPEGAEVVAEASVVPVVTPMETRQTSNPTDVSSSVDTKVSPKRKEKKTKARGGKRKISRSAENIFGAADAGQKEAMPAMKKMRPSKGSKRQDTSKKSKKNSKIDGLREMAYDSGSNASSIRSRGPVVHVEGPRDSPLSIQVVNAPREEEEERNKEKRKSVGNGNAGRSKRLSHQNDLDYRGKVSRAGLFSSTLSSRYDAHTTDSTWVCVFCKQGPHSVIPGSPSRPHPNLVGPLLDPVTHTVPAGVLSDLFGPYLIGKERLEEGILSADEQEITTEQKKGGKNKRSLRYAGLADQFSAKMSKKKRNNVENNTNAVFAGMTLLPGEEQRWEVWLHEQCAVWAAGVYMAGGRVTGLQEAVWDAAKSVCGSCGLTGANIGCVKRGCRAVSHYPCALTKGWHLDSNQYIPKCNLHREGGRVT
ncbi:uncharacterized protein LOC105695114 isoform X2 [Orussus abietinus]|uniref:uncharacterized protein LOC105695114 isoform X2 n=1 Tax=Orussus abietinus TaxID=222816 RepID=UPI0006261722|nr:uncharacterized protein LOC105695114 isoform X2 [Orussus abietinus]